MDSQEETVKEALQKSRTIAIVGLSPSEDRPSNGVARYLKKAGYRIIPVNPGYDEILGEKSYKSLSDIPERVDVVDMFVRGDKVISFVEEAVRIRPSFIWLQLGIISEESKALAERHGIGFIMDRCMKQEHARLFKNEP